MNSTELNYPVKPATIDKSKSSEQCNENGKTKIA